MKHVHITLENWEYETLLKSKKNMTWHDILMNGCDAK